MWGLEIVMVRMIIEVDSCVFQENGYWKIFCTTLPERPFALHGLPIEPRPYNELADDFWLSVTPVGGRVEDLSEKISFERYYGPKTKERES